jgi:amidophosphoribosyltransferase
MNLYHRKITEIRRSDIEDVREYVDYRSDKYQKMVEWIRKELGVTTLKYQKIDDMVEAIGLPKEKLCLYCWTGS